VFSKASILVWVRLLNVEFSSHALNVTFSRSRPSNMTSLTSVSQQADSVLPSGRGGGPLYCNVEPEMVDGLEIGIVGID